MRKYDHIFFDLDNTLWDFASNSVIALKLALEQTGLLNSINSFDEYLNVYEEINASLWDDYRNRKINKQVLCTERFNRSLGNFNITGFDPDQINSSYLEIMSEQTKLFNGTLETLSSLKRKGYQMHIITNGFREVQTQKINNCGLSDYITKTFISETIQAPKPDKRIFEYALKSTNASKKKSIMVGDSWEVDILGALNFGIDQVLLINTNLDHIPHEIKRKIEHIKGCTSIQNSKTTSFFIEKITHLLDFL